MRRRAVFFSALVVACVGVGGTPAFAAGPTAIGVDNAGVVYVGFANGGQIKRYAGTDGAPLAPWGTPGSGAGQIGGVVAIDVAPGGAGNVWSAQDAPGTRRVQEFTRAGQFVAATRPTHCIARACAEGTQRSRPASAQLKRARRRTPSRSTRPAVAARCQFHPQFFSQMGTKATPAPTDVFVDAFVSCSRPTSKTSSLLRLRRQRVPQRLGRPGPNLGDLNDHGARRLRAFSEFAGNMFIADGNAASSAGARAASRIAGAGARRCYGAAGSRRRTPDARRTAAPQIQGTPGRQRAAREQHAGTACATPDEATRGRRRPPSAGRLPRATIARPVAGAVVDVAGDRQRQERRRSARTTRSSRYDR